jgi:hypothetical protein
MHCICGNFSLGSPESSDPNFKGVNSQVTLIYAELKLSNESFLLFSDFSLEASNVFFTDAFFPLAYAADNLTEVILKLFFRQVAGTLDTINNLVFRSASGYGNQDFILTHDCSLTAYFRQILDLSYSKNQNR